jgi:outer membrane protein assembly factor BamD (BamD/ComL family)
MAKMDTATLRKHITSVLESQKKPEGKSKRKKKDRIDIESVNSSLSTSGSLEASNWYFGNQSAVAIGQVEFTRIWGTRPLEDNWRRAARTTTASRAQSNPLATQTKPSSGDSEPVAVKKDPVKEEFERIRKELPLTEPQVAEANKKIEDAYFRLGDIYYFDLLEKENAIASYERLLSRFPDTNYRPEALYKLYLIFKDTDSEKANRFATMLKEEFPNSHFAKTLVNPNYLKESSLALSKQKEMYKLAYEKFKAGDYRGADQLLNEAHALESSTFTPNLELLQILIIGQTQDITHYQLALDQFIKKYPESDVTPYAKKLLDTSRDFTAQQEKEKGIQFIQSFEESHYFVLVSAIEDRMENSYSKILEAFNNERFKKENLKVSNLSLSESLVVTLVADIPTFNSALEYYKAFNEKLPTLTELKNHKFNTFIITKDNFDIFYRTKGLDEYVRFFEKNYLSENP